MIELNDKIVACPLSGGINSAAVLCWLIDSGMIPKELHMYYADFTEHSPGTRQFVVELIKMATDYFTPLGVNVVSKITDNSVLELFDKKKMIPHPMSSPCSHILKIEPMMTYNSVHGVQVDLIGYVRTEKSRIDRMRGSSGASDMFMTKAFPIEMLDDEECFKIVKEKLGWYPAIYDILNENGKRVFKHNNCLPCKNMNFNQLKDVKKNTILSIWIEQQIYLLELKHIGVEMQMRTIPNLAKRITNPGNALRVHLIKNSVMHLNGASHQEPDRSNQPCYRSLKPPNKPKA